MRKSRQHQPLRVPNGWTDQEKAFVIQIERLLEEIYVLIDRDHEEINEIKSALASMADEEEE